MLYRPITVGDESRDTAASIEHGMRSARRGNRRLYAEKFDKVVDDTQTVLPVVMPDAGFYLWINLSEADTHAITTPPSRKRCIATIMSRFAGIILRASAGCEPQNFVRLAWLPMSMKPWKQHSASPNSSLVVSR